MQVIGPPPYTDSACQDSTPSVPTFRKLLRVVYMIFAMEALFGSYRKLSMLPSMSLSTRFVNYR